MPALPGKAAGSSPATRARSTSWLLLPDGRLVSGSGDQTLRIWNLASGASRELEGHGHAISGLLIADGGQAVISASLDGTVRVWDLAADGGAGLRHVLAGHEGAVLAIALSPDGKTLASGGADHTVQAVGLAGRPRAAEAPRPRRPGRRARLLGRRTPARLRRLERPGPPLVGRRIRRKPNLGRPYRTGALPALLARRQPSRHLLDRPHDPPLGPGHRPEPGSSPATKPRSATWYFRPTAACSPRAAPTAPPAFGTSRPASCGPSAATKASSPSRPSPRTAASSPSAAGTSWSTSIPKYLDNLLPIGPGRAAGRSPS